MDRLTEAISSHPNPVHDRPRVHITLQGKGGVGKSLVAILLAQYLRHVGVPLQCVDTDPLNDTMAQFKGLNAVHLDLKRDGKVDAGAYDELIGQILAKPSSFVVDSGVESFLVLTNYFAQTDVLELLRSEGRDVLIHTVVTGGQAFLDTMVGLNVLAGTIKCAGIVVWLNEYFGPIEAVVETDGKKIKKTFTQMKVYKDNSASILGVVTLGQRDPSTFGRDMRQMLAQKMTFEEVRESPTWSRVAKSRISRMERELYAQLKTILG